MADVIYKGRTFNWLYLNREQFRYLYYDERLTDAALAKLFSVTIYAIKQMRKHWGLSLRKLKIEKAENVRKLMQQNNEIFIDHDNTKS